jgi:hypothetical protein
MRLILRSLLLLAATAAAHCATPTPVFAESNRPAARSSPPTTSAVEVSATASAAAAATPGVPTPPAAPAPTSPVSAIEEAERRIKVVEQVVDDWFQATFHGLGPQITEFLFGHIRTAIEDLKRRLLELPL